MSDLTMCYYDGECDCAHKCKRSRKSGTLAREHQSWTIFPRKNPNQRVSAENCPGWLPMAGADKDYAVGGCHG
jgi:hypothetical protein